VTLSHRSQIVPLLCRR